MKIVNKELVSVEHYENPVLTKSGTERMANWHYSFFTDDSGNIIEILSAGFDITKRKLAEDSLTAERNKTNKYPVGLVIVTKYLFI